MIVPYANDKVLVNPIAAYGGCRIAEMVDGERYDVSAVRGNPCREWASLEYYSATHIRGWLERRSYRREN